MAKFCNHCGASLPDDKNFCTECGMPAESGAEMPNRQTAAADYSTAQASMPTYQYQNQSAAGMNGVPEKGSKYDPITTGGYIGISLLMCIPIVGLILMIIWAFGGCKKVNKRNFARASLIMMAVGVIFSLIIGFAAKSIFNTAMESAGIDIEAITDLTDSQSENGDESQNALDALAALAGMAGEISSSDSEATNSDIEELQELGNLLDSLGALTGEGSEDAQEGEEGSEDALSELIDEAVEINQQAEEANDGWPASLRAYPGGTAEAVASYRTEIKDTTLDEMLAWIEDLKKDGFAYKDFYDVGMSEEDMLGWNGWWATDGEIYLSVSYSEGTVIIDHTKELPDLSGLFE